MPYVEVHHVPFGEDVNYEDLHFPIDKGQVSDLLGQVLTHLEAMNLSEKSEIVRKTPKYSFIPA